MGHFARPVGNGRKILEFGASRFGTGMIRFLTEPAEVGLSLSSNFILSTEGSIHD